ncbi:MAG: TIGR02646 family protein, partial [Bacteroidales bacterium]|nr:TIGR02646 family protein [Bacteroidales bacterium]
KPVNWDGINEIRKDLRQYMLETEQGCQCAYCESAITSESEKSHIDHFKRKAGQLFPELIFSYNNLLVSCNNPNRCAKRKDALVKKKTDYNKLINSVNEDPSDYFSYLISGKIVSKDEKAEFTEKVFNLNHPGLKQRKDIYSAVQGYRDSLDIQDVINEIGEFEGFIRFVW